MTGRSEPRPTRASVVTSGNADGGIRHLGLRLRRHGVRRRQQAELRQAARRGTLERPLRLLRQPQSRPGRTADLAQQLKQYGISSKNIRDGGKVCKGYAAEDLADAWSRYLPSPPRKPLHPLQTIPGLLVV